MQSEEPTIIQSLENHLAEYGHTTVGQDIAAAILVIKDLHQKAALSAAEPVGFGVFNKHGDFQFACVSKEDAEKEADWEGDTVRHIFAAPAALSAQVQDVAGWQPIETAPKDGTQFLAFDKGSYLNCWWHDNGYGEQYWMDDADSEPNPSHWMPLPAAPAKQEG